MDAWKKWVFGLGMTALISALVAGCDSSSSSSSNNSTSVNYAGMYMNNGQPMAPLQTGDKVVSMQVSQGGGNLSAVDNHGLAFTGSIGSAGSDGHSPFSLTGKTTDGTSVSIVGTFSVDAGRSVMSGNWVEPTVQSTFLGFSSDSVAPASVTNSTTPATVQMP